MRESKKVLVISSQRALTWGLYNQLCRNGDLDLVTESLGQKGYRTAKLLAPDLVIIDFETPGLEQSWLTAQLQGQDPFQKVPVVVLTNSLDRSEREIAMDMLGHTFLSKQTELSRLSEQIENRLVH